MVIIVLGDTCGFEHSIATRMSYQTITVFIVVFLYIESTLCADIVCNKLKAYFDGNSNNGNCWYDPDVYASPELKAKNQGFFLEKYSVETEDDWILQIFRLKKGKLNGKNPIFLQHGLGTDSIAFMSNKNNSISFFLANEGYDVWLGNFRGTPYNRHKRFKHTDKEYSNFSYHELGMHDLPTMLKHVTSVTKKKVIYIGHSMGGTSMAIFQIMKPKELSVYVQHTIMLQPALFMRHTRGATSLKTTKMFYSILASLPVMNFGTVLAIRSPERQALKRYCFNSLADITLVLEWLAWITGEDSSHPILPEKTMIILDLFRNFVVKSYLHYAQSILTGEFNMFDYGPKGNLIMYNSTIAPSYDFWKLSDDISWIYGEYDALSTKEDILYVFNSFRKPNWTLHGIPYNHANFLIDNVCPTTLFPVLLNIINKHCN